MANGGEAGPSGGRQRAALKAMNEALLLTEQALGVLDQSGAPADVGAHLDLAIHRLQAAIHANRQSNP